MKYIVGLFLLTISIPCFGICVLGTTFNDVSSKAEFAVIGKYNKNLKFIEVEKKWRTSKKIIKISLDESDFTSDGTSLPVISHADRVILVSNQDPNAIVFLPRCKNFIGVISPNEKGKEIEYLQILNKEFNKKSK